ncbi:MAG: DUF3885 domain-containing protein [Nodosilinea sp. LVE1205-7]|jgi:hypothetical protein
MSIRAEIDKIFESRAFERPLFYSYPGGLRFELSEGGTEIEQLLCSITKAARVCEDIFDESHPPTLCLRMRAKENGFAHRKELRKLHNAGLKPPKVRSIWLEPVPEDDRFDEGAEEWWLNVAFELPANRLKNALWCALSVDLGPIRPKPACLVYLFNLARGVVVFPYDDRGMDVVGPNVDFLRALYLKHYSVLLSYDLASMQETFGAPSNNSLQGRRP